MRRYLSIACLCLLGLIAADSPQAVVGQSAPQFSLPDLSGQMISLSDYKGKTTVLEWTNPHCPFVQRQYKFHTMTDLIKKYPDVQWLSIATGYTADEKSLKQFAATEDLHHPILLDRDGAVAHLYGTTNTPEIYIIDKTGKLVYAGGIDSQPEDDANTPINPSTDRYVDEALHALATDQPIPHPQTEPYGCSIKYMR
ncbi:MAG TPA: redoxin domain-containing protein [Tepidisphaeraceae bacterium]|nr:redoxin domain-containing protein [Tepidisphaeraceae bacterium]